MHLNAETGTNLAPYLIGFSTNLEARWAAPLGTFAGITSSQLTDGKNLTFAGSVLSNASTFGDCPLPSEVPSVFIAETVLHPELQIDDTGAELKLVWPGNYSEYVVEYSNSATEFSWKPLNASPALNESGFFEVLVPESGRVSFFRLKRP